MLSIISITNFFPFSVPPSRDPVICDTVACAAWSRSFCTCLSNLTIESSKISDSELQLQNTPDFRPEDLYRLRLYIGPICQLLFGAPVCKSITIVAGDYPFKCILILDCPFKCNPGWGVKGVSLRLISINQTQVWILWDLQPGLVSGLVGTLGLSREIKM